MNPELKKTQEQMVAEITKINQKEIKLIRKYSHFWSLLLAITLLLMGISIYVGYYVQAVMYIVPVTVSIMGIKNHSKWEKRNQQHTKKIQELMKQMKKDEK